MPLLPGDYVTDSALLEEAWRGTLSEELIPLEGHTELQVFERIKPLFVEHQAI